MVSMMNNGHRTMAEWGISNLDIGPEMDILDIGCGGGANIQRLLKLTKGKVFGVDYSDVSVEKTCSVNSNEIKGGRCQVVKGDVRDLPFEKNQFNLVTAFETIYFWQDLEKAFSQVYKVLAPKGKFFICNEIIRRDSKALKWEGKIEGMRVYEEVEVEEALKRAGFVNIVIKIEEKSNRIYFIGSKVM